MVRRLHRADQGTMNGDKTTYGKLSGGKELHYVDLEREFYLKYVKNTYSSI